MSIFADARMRAGVWLRERKERIEARRAERQARAIQDVHGHSRFWLLNVPATATILAAITEWYWALLFCIEATGAVDWNWETAVGSAQPATGLWNFAFAAHLPVLVGLICATAPIVMISMIWLPVQFAMRGSGRWRRGTMIGVGLLANILVIVSGTVVMNYNRQDQVRDALVVEQTAEQGRAAIDARLTFEQEQLRLALANANPYLNQAANVGAAEWERSYVAQARASNDPRLPMLERALGAARAADQRRANIERLTVERAQAAPEAAAAANVEDTVGVGLNTFAQYVEVYRPPFIALICTMIGIFGTWWVIAMLEHMNPRDVLRSGWADEDHRIEDMREQPSPEAQPFMRQTVMREENLETGEVKIQVTPKPHWRTVKKGKPQKVSVQPEIPPSETGVVNDGGNRQATSKVAATEEIPVEPVDHANHDGSENHANDETDNIEHVEPSDVIELTADEEAALGEELWTPVEKEREDDDSGHDAGQADEEQRAHGEQEQEDTLHIDPSEQPDDQPEDAGPEDYDSEDEAEADEADRHAEANPARLIAAK